MNMETSSLFSYTLRAKDLSRFGLVGFKGKVALKDVLGHPHHDASTPGA
jgi:hypothetical protein